MNLKLNLLEMVDLDLLESEELTVMANRKERRSHTGNARYVTVEEATKISYEVSKAVMTDLMEKFSSLALNQSIVTEAHTQILKDVLKVTDDQLKAALEAQTKRFDEVREGYVDKILPEDKEEKTEATNSEDK